MTVILHLSSCCDEAVNKKSNKLKKEKKIRATLFETQERYLLPSV